MSRTAILVSILTLALAAPAPRAVACSAPYCWSTRFVPQSVEGGEVPVLPANGATLALLAWGGAATSSTITASRLRDGATTELTLTATGETVTLPDAMDGDVWTITETHSCDGGADASSATTVRIGPSASAPTSLGTLRADPPVRGFVGVADSSGSCSSNIDAVSVAVSVELDAGAQPWADALRYDTLVDGAPFFAPSTILNEPLEGETRHVFVACATPSSGQSVPDLAEGSHTVQRRAYLPGSDTALLSDEITIELRCTPPGVPDGGIGSDAGGDPVPSSSGCSVAPGAPRASALGLVALAALALLRRRARR